MPSTYPAKSYIKPEFIALTNAIENGDLAFVKANLTPQNILTSVVIESAGYALTPLHYAIYVARGEMIEEILKAKLSSPEEILNCTTGTYSALGHTLAYYGTYASEREKYQKIILIFLKHDANVMDPSVKRVLEANCISCKNDNIIKLLENLIQFKKAKEPNQETANTIADLYDKLNEPEEANKYRKGIRAYALQTGINQRDGLNKTEKNSYLAIKTFEDAAALHPHILHFAYYESLFARCHLAKHAKDDQSDMIADMQKTHDVLLTHYDKFSVDERHSIYNFLFNLLSSISKNEPDSVFILKAIISFSEKEKNVEIHQFINEALKKIIHSAVEDSIVYKQASKAFVQSSMCSDSSIEDLEYAIIIHKKSCAVNQGASKKSHEAYLSQLYKRAGKKSHGQKAIEYFQEAVNLGDTSAYISAIKAAEKEEALFDKTIELYETAVPLFIFHNDTQKINEIDTLLKNFKGNAYFTPEKMTKIDSLITVIKNHLFELENELKRNADALAKELEQKKLLESQLAEEQAKELNRKQLIAQQYEAEQAKIISDEKFLAEQIKLSTAALEAEQKEFEEINAVEINNLSTYNDYYKAIIKLGNWRHNCKTEKNKLLAAEKHDKCLMKYSNIFYLKTHVHAYAVNNYLPAVAELMNKYLDRGYFRLKISNSIRRNLFLCAKVILLTLNTEKAAKRFHMTEASITAMIEKATQYIQQQTMDNTKYPTVAIWYQKLIKHLNDTHQFIFYPDIIFINQATGESEQMRAHVLYGAKEAYKMNSATSEKIILSEESFPENLEYLNEQAQVVVQAPIVAAVQRNPLQQAKVATLDFLSDNPPQLHMMTPSAPIAEISHVYPSLAASPAKDYSLAQASAAAYHPAQTFFQPAAPIASTRPHQDLDLLFVSVHLPKPNLCHSAIN